MFVAVGTDPFAQLSIAIHQQRIVEHRSVGLWSGRIGMADVVAGRLGREPGSVPVQIEAIVVGMVVREIEAANRRIVVDDPVQR